MYFKLAKRNMERSLKDYSIYFLTLVFGVCIFYTFNSIGSQKIMMTLNEYEAHNFERVDKLMGIVSMFIACILGFLIIYANNYLIKRRKKEFGIYLTLGMERGRISRILLFETVLIGAFSLAAGLFLGVFLSQGISVFTAKLFYVKMERFKFIFSKAAFLKTMVCFGIMYLIVFLFNTASIRKLQLIDLLTDVRKNEKIKLKDMKSSVIVFIISIMFIASAYYIMLDKSSNIMSGFTIIAIILGVIGTFLFFFSLSGFLLKAVQNNKRAYLKGLNMFLLRQINSKINTTFASMSFICLMLFLSICMLAGGFSISKTLNKNIDDLAQYDSTLVCSGDLPIDKLLKNNNVDINDYAEVYVSYFQYCNENGKDQLGIRDYIGMPEGEKYDSYFDVSDNSIMPIMKLSDFNKIMKISKREKINLDMDEYAAFGDISGLIDPIQKAMDKKTKIKVSGEELTPSKNPVIEVTIADDLNKRNFCTFVVRDELIDGLKTTRAFLNLDYKGNKSNMEIAFLKAVTPLVDNQSNGLMCITREKLRADSFGLGAMISYLAMYLAIIFLITSAVVLALQQLSESADNIERYNLLRKIGVDDDMINKTIFVQVGIYFMLPLLLALIHSVVGLRVAKVVVNIFGTGNIIGQLLGTTFIFISIYGGYFWITYVGAKKMIK